MTAVRSWSVHLPGLDHAVLGMPGDPLGPAVPAERAHELLGRRGLLYKDEATRLALCAVHCALGRRPAEPRLAGPADPATAVVVSSNLGNVAVVCDVVGTVWAGCGRDVSPMQAPNVSSNVIASTIAIWFRFGGPNLTICSGATGGLDAVAAAVLLLRARRATRVVVVGVEPADPVAQRLHRNRAGSVADYPLRAAAACIVLEHSAKAGPMLGTVESFDPAADPAAGPVIGPAGCAEPDSVVLDLRERIGDTFGAAGVLGVAVATALMGNPGWTVVDGDPVAGWRRVRLGATR